MGSDDRGAARSADGGIGPRARAPAGSAALVEEPTPARDDAEGMEAKPVIGLLAAFVVGGTAGAVVMAICAAGSVGDALRDAYEAGMKEGAYRRAAPAVTPKEAGMEEWDWSRP